MRDINATRFHPTSLAITYHSSFLLSLSLSLSVSPSFPFALRELFFLSFKFLFLFRFHPSKVAVCVAHTHTHTQPISTHLPKSQKASKQASYRAVGGGGGIQSIPQRNSLMTAHEEWKKEKENECNA